MTSSTSSQSTAPLALKKNIGLLRATGIVSIMTLVSRIFGFARDMLMAHFFGAGAAVDAFNVAFRIPNFMRRLFAEGAFAQAFVPVLAEYQVGKNHDEIKNFLSHVSGTLGTVLLIITLLAELASPLIIKVFAPGFAVNSYRFVLARDMLQLTFPYLFFISLAALYGAILNTYHRFAIPAFTPVILNVVMIIATIFCSRYFEPSIVALAWGVFVAGLLQLFFQLPFVGRLHLLSWPRFGWRDPGVRRIIKYMVPALFGASVAQLNLLLDTVFASFLAIGSVSWLYYAERFSELPLGIFGVAVATVILPHLSRQHALQSTAVFTQTITWAIRNILLFALPAGIGLLICAGPLYSALFAYGAFGLTDVVMTERALWALAIGSPAFMIIKVLASVFYSRQDIRTPVKIAVVTMTVNIILNAILIFPFAHAGLALATTLAAYLNATCLWVILWRRGIYQNQGGWLKFSLQMISANGAMILWLLYWHYPVLQWLNWPPISRLTHLALLIVGGTLVYLIVLRLVGFRVRDLRMAMN